MLTPSLGLLQVGISGGMQKNDVDVRNIMLVFGGGYQLFPEGVFAEGLPVLFAGGHVVEAGHIHQVGHMAACQDACIKDGIKAESLEEGDFPAFVEHADLIGKVFFRRAFVAAELIDPLVTGALQCGGNSMSGHIGKCL